jgi:transcriptional regulator with XRE-family HTH domain
MAPSSARQELADLLRQARTGTGLTQDALARAVRKDRTTITHAEGGEPPSADVLSDILRACGITGACEAAYRAVWRLARREADPASAHSEQWFAAEQRAYALRFWQPILVPGLIQCERYAYEVYRAAGRSHEDATGAAHARMRRQEILTRRDAPTLVAVIWQPVIEAHLIGSPEVMREQCQKLLDLPDNVLLHILPPGNSHGLGGSVFLASVAGEGEVLLTANLLEDVATSDAQQVRAASATFERVRAGAMNPTVSQATITEAMRRW